MKNFTGGILLCAVPMLCNAAPLKSTLTMEELKAGEFTSAYGKRQYFKDIPEYVNTQCSTKTYTYKTPYFQFEVQEGFSIKYYTKKGGHRDYAVVAISLDKTDKAPKDCTDACVDKYYESRLILTAYERKAGAAVRATWPLEKPNADGKQSWLGTAESLLERHSSKKEAERNVITRPDKTQIIVRWHLFRFIETAARKREVEVLLPNGMILLFNPLSGSNHEVKKLEDCFLDTVIKTIKPR